MNVNTSSTKHVKAINLTKERKGKRKLNVGRVRRPRHDPHEQWVDFQVSPLFAAPKSLYSVLFTAPKGPQIDLS